MVGKQETPQGAANRMVASFVEETGLEPADRVTTAAWLVRTSASSRGVFACPMWSNAVTHVLHVGTLGSTRVRAPARRNASC